MKKFLEYESVQDLLAAIRSYEGGKTDKAYDQLYFGVYKKLPKGTITTVSKMKLREVLDLQTLAVKNGSASSAAGAYQFIKATLLATIEKMGLKKDQVWDKKLQDMMALNLLKIRGLSKFCEGEITRNVFANNLAAEWASLPMTTGAKKGKSKYAGDGLNKSHHSVESILDLVDAIKLEYENEAKGQIK